MKILIRLIVLTLLLGCVTAFAQPGKQKREWVLVDGENPVADFYVDQNSILLKNGLRRVFILVDMKITYADGQSSFQERIFKCDPISLRRASYSYIEYYSGQMLAGNLLNGGYFKDENWTEVSGSDIFIVNFVCSK